MAVAGDADSTTGIRGGKGEGNPRTPGWQGPVCLNSILVTEISQRLPGGQSRRSKEGLSCIRKWRPPQSGFVSREPGAQAAVVGDKRESDECAFGDEHRLLEGTWQERTRRQCKEEGRHWI